MKVSGNTVAVGEQLSTLSLKRPRFMLGSFGVVCYPLWATTEARKAGYPALTRPAVFNSLGPFLTPIYGLISLLNVV